MGFECEAHSKVNDLYLCSSADFKKRSTRKKRLRIISLLLEL